MTIAVIGRALVAIAQYLVGFARFFELLFRSVIPRIAIRMKLEREFAIRALQFLVAGVPRYSQHLVIICFTHSGIQILCNLFSI